MLTHQITQVSATATKTDARIVKTLHSIRTAFFVLLEQKNYEDITVQDILNQASINRTTFYKYYNSKHELAIKMVDEVKNDFIVPLLDKCFDEKWEDFAQEATRLFERSRNQLRLLWYVKTPQVHLKQDFSDMIKRKYLEAHKNHPQWDSRCLHYQAHIYATLSVANIAYVLENNDNPNSEEMRESLKYVFNLMLK